MNAPHVGRLVGVCPSCGAAHGLVRIEVAHPHAGTPNAVYLVGCNYCGADYPDDGAALVPADRRGRPLAQS